MHGQWQCACGRGNSAFVRICVLVSLRAQVTPYARRESAYKGEHASWLHVCVDTLAGDYVYMCACR